MTAARSELFLRRPRIAMLVGILGLLVLVASGIFVVWLMLAQAPGLDRLEQVTGRVKSATRSDGQSTGRTLTLVVTTDTGDYELTLPQAERLPARDWPLESIDAGAPVVAWFIPDQGTTSRGTLWQLYRGRQRVVALEDTGALYRDRVRTTLPWCTLALLSGAALIAVGFGRATGPRQPSDQ